MTTTPPEPNPATPPAGDPPTTQPPAPAPAQNDDKPLGPAGERALAAEREARKNLEKQLAPLLQLVTGADKPAGKTDIEVLQERLTNHEAELGKERAARWRAEVAHEAGLTPQQAARLQGDTRDALLADADALKALFPGAQPGTAPPAGGQPSRTPAPDPSQGARGTGPGDLDAQIADAEAKGDAKTAILLKARKLTQLKK